MARSLLILVLCVLLCAHAHAHDGFVLKAGDGEAVMNGIVSRFLPTMRQLKRYWPSRHFREAGELAFIYTIKEMNSSTLFQGEARPPLKVTQSQFSRAT